MDKSAMITLDIRGQIGPACLLLTLREVNRHAEELHRGEQHIAVLTDDRHALNIIPEAVTKMGYRVQVATTEGGYCVTIGASPHRHTP